MIIDIVFVIGLLGAMFRGFKFGLIFSIFWLLSIIVGIMAAVSFSHISAQYIQHWFNINNQYLPIISFMATLLVVITAFRLAGKLLDGFFKMIQLSFINKLVGAVIWGIIWSLLFSTLIWYVNNMELFTEELKLASKAYPVLIGFAPATIQLIGVLIPAVNDLFERMQDWFDQINFQVPSPDIMEV